MTFETPNNTDGLKERAVEELRDVAAFLDENAEKLLSDLDDFYIAEHGCRIELELLPRNSVTTVSVQKDYLVLKKCVGGGFSD